MKKIEIQKIDNRMEIFVDNNQLKIGWQADFPKGCKPQFGFNLNQEMLNILKAELTYYYQFTIDELNAILALIKCNLPPMGD